VRSILGRRPQFPPVRLALAISGLFVGSGAIGVSAPSVGPKRSSETHGGTLSPTGAMSVLRSGHTATLLPNGLVLVAGGMQRNGSPLATAELYEPATGRFRPTGNSMSTPRVGHSASLLIDGRVLLDGGWSSDGTLATAELYDPASDRFRPTGAMTSRRGDFTASLLSNGRVLVVGGQDANALATAELYDPGTETFAPTGPMRSARTMHTATVLADGNVLIAGGGEYRHPLASAEVYHVRSGAFTETSVMTNVRYKHAAIRLQDGTVLVLGGSDARDWQGLEAGIERYDRQRGSFTPIAVMPSPRFKFPEALALLADGRVLIAGGAEQPEVYDPARNVFVPTSGRLDAARFYSTATRLNDGRVLVAGGYDRTGVATNRAWIYRP
jgi:hypothetical protein